MSHARSRIDWTTPGYRALLDVLGVSVVDGTVKMPFDLGPDAEGVELVAVGWATVDLDRREADLSLELATTFEAAPRDGLLGASVRRSTGAQPQPQILILEPDTEGRLAGALAKHGEGPMALYLSVPHLDELPGTLSIRSGNGPLGTARLVLNVPPWGPFLILVGQPPPVDADRVPSGP